MLENNEVKTKIGPNKNSAAMTSWPLQIDIKTILLKNMQKQQRSEKEVKCDVQRTECMS